MRSRFLAILAAFSLTAVSVVFFSSAGLAQDKPPLQGHLEVTAVDEGGHPDFWYHHTRFVATIEPANPDGGVVYHWDWEISCGAFEYDTRGSGAASVVRSGTDVAGWREAKWHHIAYPRPGGVNCDDTSHKSDVDHDGKVSLTVTDAHDNRLVCAYEGSLSGEQECRLITGDLCPGYEDDPRPHIVGTNAADKKDKKLVGTAADEIICGLGDDDEIRGGGGDDLLLGGPGGDRIYGGAGAEHSIGGSGADHIWARGNPANDFRDDTPFEFDAPRTVDTLEGGLGNDTLFGEAGGDILRGEDGADALKGDTPEGKGAVDGLEGGASKDNLEGGPEPDHLYGGTAKDEIHGNGGDDTIHGEEGPDVLFGDGGQDWIYGGDEDDTIKGGIDDDLRLDGGFGVDTIHGEGGYDNIYGGEDGDHLYGDGGRDLIEGHEGGDDIHGGADNDTLNGGDDIDTCEGDGGVDTLDASCETATQIRYPI